TSQPTPSTDAGTGAYYERHYNYWLSVFVQLNALGNNGTLTVDTTGQDLDHIQHFVFDALAGTGRTLVVKHQGATYTIRGAAESADHLRMGSILLGHNHSFAILDAYRK
ncbi:hypothetical protein LJC04_03515, partial [Ruminococcaceae bacterium OttesenSCG-928-O06]|nr:hypothetical protein [Ruminococcaceae bacterium OttesenSCG-928-O06]